MRIAIANDSLVVIQALRRVLVKAKQTEIAWIAYSGAEALQRACEDAPDVLLMGIEMPGMKGAEATRQIMAQCPCAILIVTPSVEQHTAKVFQCLGAGALDVLNLPETGLEAYSDEAPLLAKLRTIGHLIRGAGNRKGPPSKPIEVLPNSEAQQCKEIVVIGASAGGPAALATILSALPPDFPAGIIIVQHIDFQFVASLALWLGKHSTLPVKIANEGDSPEKGVVLLAGQPGHLRFKDSHTLGYAKEPADTPYCPSVDVLFESAAHCWKEKVVGVLLTGMGRDGASGLYSLAQTPAITIAQSAAGCAVYGMPKAAIERGAAKEALPLEEIAPRLVELFPANIPSPALLSAL